MFNQTEEAYLQSAGLEESPNFRMVYVLSQKPKYGISKVNDRHYQLVKLHEDGYSALCMGTTLRELVDYLIDSLMD